MILVKEHTHSRFLYIFNFSLQKVSKNVSVPHTNWVLSFFPFKFPAWDFYQYLCLLSFEYLTEFEYLVLLIFVIILKIFLLAIYSLFAFIHCLLSYVDLFLNLAYKFFIINILFFFLIFQLCAFYYVTVFYIFGFQPCSRIFWNFYLIKISFMSSGLFPYMG